MRTSSSTRNWREEMAQLEAPPVHYTTTSDGVTLAYGAYGSGSPLLYLHSPLNGRFAAGLSDADLGPWYRRFIDTRRLILLDHRGAGLSQPGAEPPSLAGYLNDVEAVVDALGIDGMDVFAQTSSGCWVAAALATRHPHLIRRLVLFQPTPTGEDFCNDVVAGQLPLAEANWVMWTETVVGQVHSWRPSREAIRRMAATWRQTESLEHVRAIGNWSGSVDVTEILKAINVPTLVLRREHTTDAATDLAAQLIPDAQLVMVPGENYQPHLDHPDELFAEIDRFLGTGLSPGHARATNGRRAKGNGHREPLSPRELDVLTLIAAGRTNPEIAEALTIAPATASRHVHNILEKLGMSRRSEAAAYALREGLVE